MDTLNSLYKIECIRTTAFYAGPYRTLASAEFATADRIN